jgi:hypothetical protein
VNKLPLFVNKYHIKKAYGIKRVESLAFLKSDVEESEWSASRFGPFITGERASPVLWIGNSRLMLITL